MDFVPKTEFFPTYPWQHINREPPQGGHQDKGINLGTSSRLGWTDGALDFFSPEFWWTETS